MTEAMSNGRIAGGALLNAIPSPAFVLTTTLEIAAINDEFADLLGAERTTLVGARVSRVVPDRATAAIEARVSATDPSPLDTRIGTPAGDTIPVAIHFSHVSPSAVGIEPPAVVGGTRSGAAAVEVDDVEWLLGTVRSPSDRSQSSGPRRAASTRDGDSSDSRSIRWTVDGQGAHAERILKVLHDPRCRRILGAVGGPPLPAKDIADVCDLPRSTTYRKLNLLREADLVDERIEFEGCGRHATTYVRNFTRIAIDVTEGGDFRLEIDPPK